MTYVNGGGHANDYQGVFPGTDVMRHYLVLCLRTDEMVISFTITASVAAFIEHEASYRWLLKHLAIYKVEVLAATSH